jgi:hypothetical protein
LQAAVSVETIDGIFCTPAAKKLDGNAAAQCGVCNDGKMTVMAAGFLMV